MKKNLHDLRADFAVGTCAITRIFQSAGAIFELTCYYGSVQAPVCMNSGCLGPLARYQPNSGGNKMNRNVWYTTMPLFFRYLDTDRG